MSRLAQKLIANRNEAEWLHAIAKLQTEAQAFATVASHAATCKVIPADPPTCTCGKYSVIEAARKVGQI